MVESWILLELMDTGLGGWAADHTDGLAGTFAGAGVRLGALSADGQAAQMANAAITLDALQALEVHTDLAAEIAFDDILAVLDGVDDLGELLLGQIFGADARVNVGFGQDDLRVAGADAVDVTEGDIDALIRRDFYSDDAGHVLVKLVKRVKLVQ